MSLSNQSILVTGGTGSFGKAFAKTVLEKYNPKRLIIFSRDELKQHEMRRNDGFDDKRLRYFIGDVRDRSRLHRAMRDVDIVVHAAALKHVPACEYNPFEAVQTNILGAQNIIDAAIDADVKRVLALSTDKAVNPANLYGATKLVAEKIFVQGNAYSGKEGTRFSCVRYGNVVGSRGSVIPLFNEQKKSGTVTITDDRMTRFWLTLDQGVAFVLNCIEKMRGGEVFIPKIPSMKIIDLKEAVASECETRVIGIRPGEKLHESLISEDESRHAYELDDMYVIEAEDPPWDLQEWPNAKPLTEGFRYASDTNDEWLQVDDLKKVI
jgi:UDP-N-acetylglucosamine 4,6-dehydratase/5-epimerase